MARNNIRLDTPQQKEIYSRFRYLSDRYGPWQVWTDFITMSACALDQADLSQRDAREAEYQSIVARYRPDELSRFTELCAFTVDALEENPSQDFRGDLFMRFDLGNSWKGQFFTPYNLCAAMAQITSSNLKDDLERRFWVPCNDPACGAGATLIAHANECRRQGVNYQTSVLYVGQDIDRPAALMCYVQLSLLGCPGYIVVGNTLTNPSVGPLLFPQRQEGQEIWYTPMFFSSVWAWRRRYNFIDIAMKEGTLHEQE